jgi:hypothetical protein
MTSAAPGRTAVLGIVRFAHISYDAETGIYSFSIETSTLVPGLYRLLIGSADGEMSYHMDLSIVEANR